MTHRAYRYAAGAAIFFVLSLSSALHVSAVTDVQGSFTDAVRPQIILPTHISIPTARVNADIIDVGVTSQGNLDVPHNYTQAGWYRYGAVPGQNGNAVIDAHVDNGGRIPGPFKHLVNAEIGDDITVTLSDGSKAVYSVISSIVYSTTAFPAESVFVGTGSASILKLITCNGTFSRKTGTYDHRLIVTAVRKGMAARTL